MCPARRNDPERYARGKFVTWPQWASLCALQAIECTGAVHDHGPA